MGLVKKNPDTPPEEEDRRVLYEEDYDMSTAMERLTLAAELVSSKFNLVPSGYRVVKFNDKGKIVDITLDGADFIVSVTIKNSEMHGMYIPPKQVD